MQIQQNDIKNTILIGKVSQGELRVVEGSGNVDADNGNETDEIVARACEEMLVMSDEAKAMLFVQRMMI